MIRTTFTINSPVDNLPLDVLLFECECPKGIVQICHGMSEHKERYIPFMKYLYDHGYASIIHDHRGHGKSVLSVDDIGYLYDGGHKALVEDVYAVNQFIHEKYPNLPVVLFGHSMGSLVVRAFTKEKDDTIDGLIVCGSPSENKLAAVGKSLSKIIMKTKGGKYHSNLIHEMAFGSYNKGIKRARSKNSWLCTDPTVVEKYDKDELCGFVFTANGFYNLFDMMQYVYNKTGWKKTNEKLPIHFIAGSNDPCITSQKLFSDAVNFMRGIGYKSVTSKLYPKMRHEILNEVGKERVYSDVVENMNVWCRRK